MQKVTDKHSVGDVTELRRNPSHNLIRKTDQGTVNWDGRLCPHGDLGQGIKAEA